MQIIQSNYKNIGAYAEACFRDTPPPCSAACPLGVDVRGLVSKVKAGRKSAAFRAYREAVLFPNVVSALCTAPCTEVCARAVRAEQGSGQEVVAAADRAVDLRRIEQGVCEGAEKRSPSRYAIPKKNEKIAIVGAGISGLACAQRLASKGYTVNLFDSSDKAGGSICGAVSEEMIDEDLSIAFGLDDLHFRLGEEIGRTEIVALLSENDAVYICTGSGGEDFGLLDEWDPRTLSTVHRGVFLGGDLVCRYAEECDVRLAYGVASAIENGLRAAASIEEYIKTGCAEGSAELFDRKPFTTHYYDLTYDFAEAGNTGDAAADEAARCPECNCSACIDACTMIRWFKQNPKRIAADLEVTLLPVEGKIKHVASRMLNSCNLCGLCGSVCPAHVDTGVAMQESRRLMKQGGNIPAAFHDYWLSDMEFSLSDEAYGVVLPDGQTTTNVVFFPGCQMAASLPATVAKTFEYLREKEPCAAMMLSCCGVPADWAAEQEILEGALVKIRTGWEALGRPQFLYACATCKKTFEKYLPEAEGQLIYEWLAGSADGLLCIASGSDSACASGEVSVYDPCAARGDEAGRNAVRRLIRALGLDIIENNELNGEHAACCGFGGHIYPANPGLLNAILEERREDNPMITYCANCRDLFISKGYAATHLLETFFGNENIEDTRYLPSLTKRRENRLDLKARYFPEMRRVVQYDQMDILVNISSSVEEKMNRLLLLREDVCRAVSYCEETGKKLVDPENGRFIGCLAGDVTTVWVEYAVDEKNSDTLTLHNVYTHRMRVLGPGSGVRASDVDTHFVCANTKEPLELRETKFTYLDHEFTHKVPWCPSCEMTYISEELATGKIAEVEAMLEDK